MLEYINSILSGLAVPLALCAAGLFYLIRLRFFFITHPLHTLGALRSARSAGKVSPLGALTLALAGTLGVGNIVGVCSAIVLGGFGAVFWIWVSAIFAMVLKYAEIVIAMRHRRIDADGKAHGSAMLYILDFFKSIGHSRMGVWVSRIFAAAFVLCSLSMGSMLQAGAISDAVVGVFGAPRALLALLLGLFSLTLAMRGTGAIVKFTNLLVPLMSVGYTVMALAVIAVNVEGLGNAFFLIFSNALSPRSALGGVGGFAFMRAVRYGVMRGLVSNEAGCGTAPTAHALAEGSTPHTQGIFGILEVFIDTVVLCTLSALVIILEYDSVSCVDGNYMMMCIQAFGGVLGSGAAYFLAIAVLCFGTATVACWIHYGASAFEFLFPHKTKIFPLLYAACTALGACLSAEFILALSDLSMSIMALINLTVITQMSKEMYGGCKGMRGDACRFFEKKRRKKLPTNK